jgi:hypothetical protein
MNTKPIPMRSASLAKIAESALMYVAKAGQTYGPYSPDEVRQYIRNGTFALNDQACVEGGQWRPIHAMLGVPPPPPPPQTVHHVHVVNAPKRSFNGIKAIGALIIFASVPTCCVAANARPIDDTWMSIGTLGFVGGFVLFIIGRFRD